MNWVTLEIIIILGGIGVIIVSWLILRFGKVIARALLVVGALSAVLLMAFALASQSVAQVQTAKAASAATIAASTGTLLFAVCGGALGTLVLVGTGAAGIFYLRWQLAERRAQALPRQRAQAALPDREQAPDPLVYADQQDQFDLTGVDLSAWGW